MTACDDSLDNSKIELSRDIQLGNLLVDLKTGQDAKRRFTVCYKIIQIIITQNFITILGTSVSMIMYELTRRELSTNYKHRFTPESKITTVIMITAELYS